MKYLVQTNNITEEKSNKKVYYDRVILDTTDNSVYIVKGFDYNLIDLGLPSGTLWMDRNIGAKKPEDYGLYFAWGETQGYTADEVGKTKQFIWADYKYANGDEEKLTKYCNNSSFGNEGYTDNLTELESSDDAAYLYTKGNCKMPTNEQVLELLSETDVYLIKADGTEVHGTYAYPPYYIIWDSTIGNTDVVSGFEFRRKSNNSIKIFMPFNILWCSDQHPTDTPIYAWLYWIDKTGIYLDFRTYDRCYGCSIRGIKI